MQLPNPRDAPVTIIVLPDVFDMTCWKINLGSLSKKIFLFCWLIRNINYLLFAKWRRASRVFFFYARLSGIVTSVELASSRPSRKPLKGLEWNEQGLIWFVRATSPCVRWCRLTVQAEKPWITSISPPFSIASNAPRIVHFPCRMSISYYSSSRSW